MKCYRLEMCLNQDCLIVFSDFFTKTASVSTLPCTCSSTSLPERDDLRMRPTRDGWCLPLSFSFEPRERTLSHVNFCCDNRPLGAKENKPKETRKTRKKKKASHATNHTKKRYLAASLGLTVDQVIKHGHEPNKDSPHERSLLRASKYPVWCRRNVISTQQSAGTVPKSAILLTVSGTWTSISIWQLWIFPRDVQDRAFSYHEQVVRCFDAIIVRLSSFSRYLCVAGPGHLGMHGSEEAASKRRKKRKTERE